MLHPFILDHHSLPAIEQEMDYDINAAGGQVVTRDLLRFGARMTGVSVSISSLDRFPLPDIRKGMINDPDTAACNRHLPQKELFEIVFLLILINI